MDAGDDAAFFAGDASKQADVEGFIGFDAEKMFKNSPAGPSRTKV